jgi:lipid II:glycine glycyltransferase (peptidoglycan interpeptide bridge formation enzyme)
MNQPTLTIRPANIDDQKQWNTFVDHPLQTWQWGEFRKQMGVDVVRLIAGEGKNISQCWQMTFHSIPHTPLTIGYFPKGPLPNKLMIEELIKLGKQKRAIYIQLEPNVDSKTIRQKDSKTNSDLLPSYRLPVSSSLRPSHHPLFTKYTFILDLTKSEDELLKAMHSKTRYNIRLAQKHGVVIKEDSSDLAFTAYLKLSEETTERQRFYAHNRDYHQTMWNTLRESGIAKLFTASYNNKIITAWIMFCFNDTIYYPYGASSRNHREIMAPNLILWELIRWAKEKGFNKFDLWGAMGPNPDTHDPWYGFHRFKEGYHPELVEFIGSYDLVINPFLYKLYCIGDTVRWRLLKLRSKL